MTTTGWDLAMSAIESTNPQDKVEKMAKSEEQWRAELSEEAFEVTRKGGTERAFTGRYWDTKTKGVYLCSCCQEPLFSSATKYESGTGWPSFYTPISSSAIAAKDDTKLGMKRTEVVCSRCEAHLGHVFPDGPEPTGLRYCLNSASLYLEEEG